jgi:hypothetical protein
MMLIAPQFSFYASLPLPLPEFEADAEIFSENNNPNTNLTDTSIQSGLVLEDKYLEYLKEIDLAEVFPQPAILLGTHDWLSLQLLREAGKYLEKAVFPCGFNPESVSPRVKAFTENFSHRFGQKPDLLAAQAYDATQILISRLDKCRTREELRDFLSAIQNFQGITGITSFTPHGDSLKELHMVGIRNSKFLELEGNEDWLCHRPMLFETFFDDESATLSETIINLESKPFSETLMDLETTPLSETVIDLEPKTLSETIPQMEIIPEAHPVSSN